MYLRSYAHPTVLAIYRLPKDHRAHASIINTYYSRHVIIHWRAVTPTIWYWSPLSESASYEYSFFVILGHITWIHGTGCRSESGRNQRCDMVRIANMTRYDNMTHYWTCPTLCSFAHGPHMQSCSIQLCQRLYVHCEHRLTIPMGEIGIRAMLHARTVRVAWITHISLVVIHSMLYRLNDQGCLPRLLTVAISLLSTNTAG